MTRSGCRVLGLALIAAALAAGCGRGAAEEALAAATAALERATPEVKAYVPDELEALSEGMAGAKVAFARGNYKAALAAAQALVPKIQAAAEAARKKKEELVAAFDALKGRLPGLVESLTARLAKLSSTQALPQDLDQATVEAARANLDSVTRSWHDALGKFDRGDVVAGVAQATEVKTQVEELAKVFLPAPARPRK